MPMARTGEAQSSTMPPASKKRATNRLPGFQPPELATLVANVPEESGWLFEMKYDGYRCLAAISDEQVRLYTRNGNDWTDKFSQLSPALAKLTTKSALIDGEICALDRNGRTDFSTLKEAISTGGPLVYFVFDLLELDGKDLRQLPLQERRARLGKLIGKTDQTASIRFSEQLSGEARKIFRDICQGGFEGVIAKRADAPYRNERSGDWLKVKCIKRQEFVIAGWSPSEKKDTFASLLIGTWEDGKLVYRGRVGTGFGGGLAGSIQQALDERSQEDSAFAFVPRSIARRAHWVRPELVGEVAFTEFTPDGILRHPSFVGLREDKPASMVGMEIADAPRTTQLAKARISDEAGIAAAEREKVRLTSPDRVAYPGQGITKAELVAYYDAVSARMLPYIIDRPLSLVRCPQGRAKYCFFQKHDTGGFPEAMKSTRIIENSGAVENYFYIDDLPGLIAGTQMNVLEWHLWGSRREAIEKPDRIIFDIDPDAGMHWNKIRDAAFDIGGALEDLGLHAFPMLSGGKGVHVIAPLTPKAEWPDVKAFCKAVAQKLAQAEPDRFVVNMSKAKRKGKIFIDYLRNERGATAIAPYSARSREGAPVATPVSWDELKSIEAANQFSLEDVAARMEQKDPWHGYFDVKQAISAKLLKAVEISA